MPYVTHKRIDAITCVCTLPCERRACMCVLVMQSRKLTWVKSTWNGIHFTFMPGQDLITSTVSVYITRVYRELQFHVCSQIYTKCHYCTILYIRINLFWQLETWNVPLDKCFRVPWHTMSMQWNGKSMKCLVLWLQELHYGVCSKKMKPVSVYEKNLQGHLSLMNIVKMVMIEFVCFPQWTRQHS